ncbi:hypothetical protein V3C99_018127 [Haemonchus contortus]|uniref:Transposase n=1 Tax=Haemonchus contortus TaxID=6289 RepID=A0A7I4Z2A9_HAECO
MDMGVTGGQLHNGIDHIIVNPKFSLDDIAVVPKFYTGSGHRLLRANSAFQRVERELQSSGNEALRLLSTLLRWRANIFTIAPEKRSLKDAMKRLSLKSLELLRQRRIARAAGNNQLS